VPEGTGLPERVSARLASASFPLLVRLPNGRAESFGPGEPLLEVRALNERGLEALGSLKELEVVEAYMRGDVDLDGDLLAAMDLRDVLSDTKLHIKAWTFVQPLLFGRRRLNPGWIARHYDS
jgi:cyclopropane-fatty-acyl-phospholipid synthase